MQDPKKTKQAHNSGGDSTHDQTASCALACAGSAVRRDNENSHDNYFAGVGRYSPVDGTAATASLPGLPTASVTDFCDGCDKETDDLHEDGGMNLLCPDCLKTCINTAPPKAGR